MFLSVKDALLLGGTLIMLPESDIKILVDSEEFEGDTADAYREIANITAGVLTAVFEA